METVVGVVNKEVVQSGVTYPLIEGDADALVLQCSDPRFQDAFYNFVRQELGVKKPATIGIPGSTASFGVQTFLPKSWHALRKQIELMVEHNDFPRVILINHDDCRGYASVARWLGRFVNLGTEQRRHLKTLAEYLRKDYLPNSQLEMYQARIVEQESKKTIKFERVL